MVINISNQCLSGEAKNDINVSVVTLWSVNEGKRQTVMVNGNK